MELFLVWQVEVVALSSYEEKEEQFKEQVCLQLALHFAILEKIQGHLMWFIAQ
jgi:hypothetical protein